jgi:hypothetical protein
LRIVEIAETEEVFYDGPDDAGRESPVSQPLFDLCAAPGTDSKIAVGAVLRLLDFLFVMIHGQTKRAATQGRPYNIT